MIGLELIWVRIGRVGIDSGWNCERLGTVSISTNLKKNKFLMIGLEMIGLDMIGLEMIGLEMIVNPYKASCTPELAELLRS